MPKPNEDDGVELGVAVPKLENELLGAENELPPKVLPNELGCDCPKAKLLGPEDGLVKLGNDEAPKLKAPVPGVDELNPVEALPNPAPPEPKPVKLANELEGCPNELNEEDPKLNCWLKAMYSD